VQAFQDQPLGRAENWQSSGADWQVLAARRADEVAQAPPFHNFATFLSAPGYFQTIVEREQISQVVH
jgi:hypothetical protein